MELKNKKKQKKKQKKNFFWNTTTAPAELFPHCSQIKTNDKIRELVVSALIPIFIHRLVAILKENKKNSIAWTRSRVSRGLSLGTQKTGIKRRERETNFRNEKQNFFVRNFARNWRVTRFSARNSTNKKCYWRYTYVHNCVVGKERNKQTKKKDTNQSNPAKELILCVCYFHLRFFSLRSDSALPIVSVHRWMTSEPSWEKKKKEKTCIKLMNVISFHSLLQQERERERETTMPDIIKIYRINLPTQIF